MEMGNLDTYYAQNVQVRVRNLMAIAKNQIDFKLIHADYVSVRNNLLLSFLINEQISLKNHLRDRAESILRQAEQIEQTNKAKIINNVMSETMMSIDQAYEQNKQKIEADFFDLALEGISKGRMDYAKDPILPYVIATINKKVQAFEKISAADQQKLVSINEQQIQMIRNTDAHSRDEFVNQ